MKKLQCMRIYEQDFVVLLYCEYSHSVFLQCERTLVHGGNKHLISE